MKRYQRISQLVDAYHRCVETNNTEWEDKHLDAIRELERNELPRGNGFDSGTTIDLERSKDNYLVLSTSYHHMNENGYYDGWTDHDIIVKPDMLNNITLRITGRDRDGWKDYAWEVFYWDLVENTDD